MRSAASWMMAVILVAVAACAGAGAAAAQTQTPAELSLPADLASKDISVGVKAAPPFAFKLQDGTWSGLSIDLWQKIAGRLNLRFHYVEVPGVQDQIDGVASGKFDVAMAAITVTADREKAADFSQPFFTTGLGIATPLNSQPSWRPILHALTSFGFLQAVLALVVISVVVGVLIWMFERRHNDDFGGGVAKGLFSSMWWSTIAATQASTGDFGPRTVPGRVLAALWMMGSIIAIAVFTAGVTSVLTVTQMEGMVQGESDLGTVRVGAVRNSSTASYLDSTHIRHQDFDTIQQGLDTLRTGKIDALVHDKPLLGWLVGQNYGASLRVLDATFDQQQYAIALPLGSRLRKPLDVALLQTMESDWWKQAVFQYLGEK
ncbi:MULTISPECIES: transporter substrate-binding domain-containing protein [unclassified Mesorhizobium]|uniref:transporter substrate-binding domain-containing protein n=1 Tax=unclassified Mesorhizobium TaxID=325217 RepID=UPI001CCA3F14|nr:MULTISPECIES: transporter substrate-binding domain-containing protein [unclassified Mesorhizobium]MBZ9742097.1 transporter substrate-binding domain-containing protein [Mesorhizobium sp. CO1-1-4]MBZ9804738.1 transporter substrate-binding domain-containing protein [Mesorhizobium sp. ES1-6]